MVKKKTLKKQKFSFEAMPITKFVHREGITESDPDDAFKDSRRVGAALLECLADNDTETFIEILDAYLDVNRMQVAKGADMPRSTIQQALSAKGNPTLKTLAKIVHQSVALADKLKKQ